MSTMHGEDGASRGAIFELFEIFGASHAIEVDGETLSIKPLTLGELAGFLHWHGQAQLTGDGAESEANASAEAEIRVIEILTRQSFEWLSSLADEDRERVIRAAFGANPTLFCAAETESPPSSRIGRSKLDGKSLQPAIAQLVEAGQSLEDIKGYTLQQVDILCRAHARLAAERQINTIISVRAAQADAKNFKGVIDALEKSAPKFR